nr:serine/threonine protein kinase [Deltaproteobacteria bacterium]
MADDSSARPRTNTRLRGEAPAGYGAGAGEETRQRIGRYEVIKTIGKGAMGVVYKARDPLLDRIVAVKTIVSPQGVGKRVRSAYLERFQREAKAAAKMQHPAIVTIFDVGIDEEWGAPFMVLEYLPGESLADRLDRVRMPLGRAVQIALDLASAMGFAHRQRIVHRDVKPANVLHAGENRWKLADFGIARLPDSDLTQVGIFMRTPGYSPPEAIREGRYTPQADVFAWGAVFYELLSGRIPYEGPDTKTTNSYVVQGNAPPPTRHDPSIPEPLSTVTMTALQPSDRNRFKDASEAEQALREAWDRCLMQGIIHPSVLAMEETAHDKAPVRMHDPRGGRPVAPANNDSQEVTAIDSKLLSGDKPLQIESTKKNRRGEEDDDPTMLH